MSQEIGVPCIANVPVIDLSGLNKGSAQRSAIIDQINNACRHFGIFKIVNHGISPSIIDGVMSAASEFFDLPNSDKLQFMSDDIHKPMRYASTMEDGGHDNIKFKRAFLKHYANPLEDWVHLWPHNPPTYREAMGKYCTEVKKLSIELIKGITESLELRNITRSETIKKLEEGMQVMAVNGYPACPGQELGLPPHSDYGFITILFQGAPGLQILDLEDGKWKLVPKLEGSLEVHVGDHLEILSNGLYKSLVHRVALNCEKARISIASLHSYGMDEKMGPAEEMVGPDGGKLYKESSFGDFLNFHSGNGFGDGKTFIETLKINT